MQDGAARVLQIHLARKDLDSTLRRVFQNALDHLLSRDPAVAWTSGQWMTERTGGSDVSLTETIASFGASSSAGSGTFADEKEGMPLGPWSISGFKWFSSATDCNMTILLARTAKGGISAFFAPLRRDAPTSNKNASNGGATASELNGVRLQRLKNKMGTRSLPTAELELDGMRGWLIGSEGRGVNEISVVLTLTRIHSAVAAVGYLGRGLGIAKAYARVRTVGSGRGRRMALTESELHMRTLADITAGYHGLMLLTMFTVHLLGLDEQGPGERGLSVALTSLTPSQEDTTALLRVMTPLAKAYVSKNAVPLLYSCMEALGGVGYMNNEENEYLNVSRIYRDCCVLPIWEGTTDVLSTDFIRALKHPKGGKESIEALDRFITGNSWGVRDGESLGFEAYTSTWAPAGAWMPVKAMLVNMTQEELIRDARYILWAVAEALIGVLLYIDSRSDGSRAAGDMLSRFVAERSSSPEMKPQSSSKVLSKENLTRDHAIVYGPKGIDDTNSEKARL
jgi:alkylation response protein AidB-like acyl-CoA dehydrogenase